MKKNGFTLAEVLITIALIGLVATLVLPALFTNMSKHSYVAALKKNYNTITNALAIYMAESSADTLRETDIHSEAGLKSFVNNYFKVHTDCEGFYNKDDKVCFAKDYNKIDHTSFTVANNYCMETITLEDGSALCFDVGEATSKEADYDVNGDGVIDENDKINNGGAAAGASLTIEIDINGIKGPNIAGRDLFSLSVDNRGKIYDPLWEDEDKFLSSYESAWPFGIEKIIRDGWEMKY